MQKLEVAHDTQLMKGGFGLVVTVPIGLGALHEVPFHVSQSSPPPSARQKLAEGHETAASISFPSIGCGAEKDEPFQTTAVPLFVTPMQKVGEGHDTECAPSLNSTDHVEPSQTRISPSSSGATQKFAEAQDTPMMPSAGLGHRISAVADHEEPFQTRALPSGAPARQKVGVGHDTWLTSAWPRLRGADHEVPFQVTTLPVIPGPDLPTAAQNVGVGQETE